MQKIYSITLKVVTPLRVFPTNTRYGSVVVRSQLVAALMPQRQNNNVAPTLPQRWIVSSTHSVL